MGPTPLILWFWPWKLVGRGGKVYIVDSISDSLQTQDIVYMDVSENNGTPKSSIFLMKVFHYKPSILGYPYFWKHPYTHTHRTHQKQPVQNHLTLLLENKKRRKSSDAELAWRFLGLETCIKKWLWVAAAASYYGDFSKNHWFQSLRTPPHWSFSQSWNLSREKYRWIAGNLVETSNKAWNFIIPCDESESFLLPPPRYLCLLYMLLSWWTLPCALLRKHKNPLLKCSNSVYLQPKATHLTQSEKLHLIKHLFIHLKQQLHLPQVFLQEGVRQNQESEGRVSVSSWQ